MNHATKSLLVAAVLAIGALVFLLVVGKKPSTDKPVEKVESVYFEPKTLLWVKASSNRNIGKFICLDGKIAYFRTNIHNGGIYVPDEWAGFKNSCDNWEQIKATFNSRKSI